ncbi:angio-associated migratory cell protein [Lingula anatina]|uniref:Angio-associated migratory cell protein n=1 Tax=Lingula anatina TaxID=7574 RepID=A0A1S3H6L1_LINAN|nr:angio-associated migratory cell protein [Lingula anatina]|eukprot:XP_013381116.1 angio-associated migratory cell protein [Lingula anatina]
MDPSNIEDTFELNEEDIEEVIEFNNSPSQPEALAEGMEDMDLDQYDGDGGVEDEDKENSTSLPLRDDADLVFTEHKGSVFCVQADPVKCEFAVSGGEDDLAYLWKIDSGQVVLKCTGHKDSVTQVAFSHDSQYLATGDMSGIIKVWKVDTKVEIWSFECTDLEWLRWHHCAHILLAGTVDGEMWMWKIPGGDCKTFQGQGCTCSEGRILPDGKRACTGYDDGTVKIWDLKEGSPLHSISGHDAHDGAITCIDCHPDNVMVVTGSVDVTAKVINSNNGKVVTTFNCKKQSSETDASAAEKEDSVEAVGCSPNNPYLATGTLAGSLCFWDLTKQTVRQQCDNEAGIVRLKWDNTSPMVYTGSLDGTVRLWDARTGKTEAQWMGHGAEILDLTISRDGNHLLTSSSDETVRVYSLHSPDR